MIGQLCIVAYRWLDNSIMSTIITNKTVEMIAMKIFKFVEVATQSHRQEETGGFF